MSAFQDAFRATESYYDQADPGDGASIAPTCNPCCIALVSGGAETRTLPDPDRVGLILALTMETNGGDIVVTASTAINQNDDTIMTFGAVDDHITLLSVKGADGLRWQEFQNDGAALS